MEYITLKLSATTLNTIGAALQEIAHKYAAPALKEIDEQVKIYLAEKQNVGISRENSKAGNPDGEQYRVPDVDAPRYGKDQPEG